MVNEITSKTLENILNVFKVKAFHAGKCEIDTAEYTITKTCEELLKLDYKIAELDNTNGRLCPAYPSRILIPFARSRPQDRDENTNDGKIAELKNYLQYATFARCRRRFVVPVIFYDGKCVCRSATLSVRKETYARKALAVACNFVYNTHYGKEVDGAKCEEGEEGLEYQSIPNNNVSRGHSRTSSNGGSSSSDNGNHETSDRIPVEDGEHEDTGDCPFTYDEVIAKDVELLKFFNVDTIVDLMVELEKVKYFLTVSTSEKAQNDKYKELKILALPYPGSEFYTLYRNNNYEPVNLHYDWSQSFNNAKIEIPTSGPANSLNINWNNYKGWDLVTITQNYLRAILKYIQDEDGGLLIHCISGWDRTPLFVSLVRLSLWADGLIHRSLNPLQMTYFTVAYDWYLFGHQLPSRLSTGEDIMFFCFDFLKYLHGEEFMVTNQRVRSKTPNSEIWDSFIQIDETSNTGSEEYITTNEDSNDGAIPHNCEDLKSILNDINIGNGAAQSPISKRIKTELTFNPQTDNNSIGGSWEDIPQVLSVRDDKTPSVFPFQLESNSAKTCKMSPAKKTSSKINSPKLSPKNVTPTVPIEIPSGGFRRGRSESESSFVMVSELGSLESKESNCGQKDEAVLKRRKKLEAVRKIFVTAYHRSIGMRFPENTNLGMFLGEIANQMFTMMKTTVEEMEEEVEAESSK